MNNKQRAAYIRQEKLHEERKDNPSREEWTLRQAADESPLTSIEYEYKIETEDRWYWFDVKGEYEGRTVLVDLVGGYGYSGGSARRKEIEQEKRDVCEQRDIPLIQIHKSRTKLESASMIRTFLLSWKPKS